MTNRFPDLASFTAAVLWIHGRTVGEVASVVKWTPGQVRGFIHREFGKKPRDHMSMEERSALLNEFHANRPDDGLLPIEVFTPLQLHRFPSRPEPIEVLKRQWVADLVIASAEEDYGKRDAKIQRCKADYRTALFARGETGNKPPLVDPTTKDGRKLARDIESDVLREVKAIRSAKEEREAGMAQRGTDASAFEYLIARRLLRDPDAAALRTKQTDDEARRMEAGTHLRSLIDGTRIGGLGAIDYERATMGGGGGANLSASAYRLHCINTLGAIRSLMSTEDYLMIEAILDQEIFVWERVSGRARGVVYEDIRRVLDIISVYDSRLLAGVFTDRWGYTLPAVEWALRGEAEAIAEAARDILEGAR